SVVVLLAVLVLAAAGYVGFRQWQRAQDRARLNLQTATVERGTLVATVSGAGTVRAASSVNLAFQASGQVSQVLVKEGDRVRAGQEIARLEATDAELQVEQAEANLYIAEARLEQVRKGPLAEEIEAARAGLASAEENLSTLRAGVDPMDLEIARLRWEQAKDQLWAAQSQRDAIGGNPLRQAELGSAQASVASAEMAAEIARLQYERAKAGPSVIEIRAAEAQVAQAAATLARLLSAPSNEDIRVAEGQVRQAEVALKQARHRLAQTCLVAPRDGTVTHLSIEVGQVVAPNAPVATLSGSDVLEVVADMSEVDVARIRAGQEVHVTLDALPEQVLKGKVVEVAPAGASTQGVVSFPVTIRFEQPGADLRPGMTANVAVVIERREDVLLVPSRAIRTQGGKRLVRVLRAGEIADVAIEVGLRGDGNAEVLGGALREGDVVVLTPPSSLLGL
ncbi:MAG: efflux RND transporter periplasmic adaptor subunit, partial [Anaerolineae bacterium]|nr:efflux RND transporter periplasmic adaptor subunit [Anaerolineae bacterium]